MNKKERIKTVRAMDRMTRCINDEEIFMTWLSLGVADGDCNGTDEDLECYVEDDDDFKELLALFSRLMVRASKDGLYCDGVCC